ncbi:cytidylate kinase family protein [Oceanidesulfovibrio marinus]|nr:cytidylate kinase family protein [Oceanidesulfovibrio marinus]
MLKRIVVFVVALFVMAVGVALSVKANLGVSPISCIPYVYSLKIKYTLGELTIAMNTVFIVAQILILRKNYSLLQLVQLPAIIVFGFCIDLALFLLSSVEAPTYALQVFWCLLSCVTIAFGVFLAVKARITYLPGDGLALVIADAFKKEFGKLKVCFDSSMVVIGVVSSFVLLGKLAGIREGTIAAALLVGYLVKVYNKRLAVIDTWLRGNTPAGEEITAVPESSNLVITIAREYGSGGHGIGQCIAQKLGISFYDKELINITAEKSGFTTEYIEHNEQRLANSLLDELYAQSYAYVDDKLPPSDVLFLVQSKIIREICNREPCVIVGRCANFVLKDNPNCFNVFIHANKEYRRSKLIGEYGVVPENAMQELERSDRERANYCSKYTGSHWQDLTNYHMSIDSSLYTTEQVAQKIIDALQGTALQPQLAPAKAKFFSRTKQNFTQSASMASARN